MENYSLNEEQEHALYAVSCMLMQNNQKEAEAVKGYEEQLEVLSRARAVCEGADPALIALLERLYLATQEKIQDELNHGISLYGEFVELTGIAPKEE